MADDIKAVEFVAEIRQVKTMADHTVNVTLNLPEYCKPQAAWFMQHQGEMVKAISEISIRESLTELDDEVKEETEGSGYRVGSRRIRDRRDQRAGREIQTAV